MKKLNYLLIGFAGLSLASCSNEDVMSKDGAENIANVTISLDIPQIATRSYSDGTTATQLQYAVYYVNSDGSLAILPAQTHAVATGSANGAETINTRTQVNFQLVTNRTYGFVFWASKAGAPYNVTFGTAGASLSVDYTSPNITANNEDLDAFYVYESFKVEGDTQKTFQLKRPFAQINVGANDYADAENSGFTVGESHIKVSEVYATLNLINGQVSDKQQNGVDFAYKAIPAKYDANAQTGEQFPVAGYDYLAMAYVLVPTDQQTVEVSFDAKDANNRENAAVRTVGSVPVQRNYRTNIYGKLFTSNVDINVEIVPAYIIPDYHKVLDATALSKALAQGGTVVLENDITLSSILSVSKDATIDLNGHTLTSPSTNSSADDGLITVRGGANVTITGNGNLKTAGTYASILVWCDEESTVNIENGTFTSNSTGNDDEVIYIGSKGGTINIKGGTFQSPGASNKFLLNCYDEAYKAGIAKFNVTGGLFKGYNPAVSASENPVATDFVPEGYQSVEKEVEGQIWYEVSKI